jgi:hypothetical protein
MGCRCNNSPIMIEQKTEYKTESNNSEINNNFKELTTNNKQITKEEEIDTTIKTYPEAVFNLINQIRANPKEYADTIEESINYIIEEKDENNPSENKIIFKNQIKVALVRGEEAFKETAEELKNMESMEPLEFREENCLTLPDDIEEDNSNFLKSKVKEKLKDNININIFFKEKISIPEISVLLMIVDDRNKKDSGKKRKAILNRDFKFI